MSATILRNYKTDRADTSAPLPCPPQQTSQAMNWRGLYLSHEIQPACETPTFNLNTYRLGLSTSHSVELSIVENGKRRSGNAVFGQFTIMPPNDYSVGWDQTAEFLILDIEPDYLNHQAELLLGQSQVELISHFSVTDPLIVQLSRTLQAELSTNHQPSGSPLYAEAVTDTIVMHLLCHYSSSSTQPHISAHGLHPSKLNRVIDYIQANLSQDISLNELATIAQLNQFHFSRAFKAATGSSPYRYVIEQRIEKAKTLLKHNQLSIGEVAQACGFSHSSHLSQHFKRIVGTTPSRFLRSS